jgi:hypothetical protein
VICNDDDLPASLLDHLANELGFGIRGNRTAILQTQAVHAEDRLVGKYLSKILDRKPAGEGVGARLELASHDEVLKTRLTTPSAAVMLLVKMLIRIAACVSKDLRSGGPAVDEASPAH